MPPLRFPAGRGALLPQDEWAPGAGTVSRQHAKPAKNHTEPLTGRTPPEDSEAILRALSRGEIELKGRLRWSSNATFLVEVHPPGENRGAKTNSHTGPSKKGPQQGPGDRPMLAIYKPTKGERPLWDFPHGLWKREVAAYELDCALGWNLIPPTAARLDAPLGPGSLQYFVDALVDEHYFSLLEEPRHHEALRRVAAFDLVANNADRKSGHCLLDRQGHIWAIDNGLCFHTEPKLRTVIWDFAGDKIGHELLTSLEPLSRSEVPNVITSLLDEEEIAALSARAAAVFARGRFPEPSGDFPYPWPLV
jgi:uncharacterized repeat protein (TIGR03843 family)